MMCAKGLGEKSALLPLRVLSIGFEQLFRVKKSILQLPAEIESNLQNLLKFMKMCDTIPWRSPPKRAYENIITVDIATQVLHPIFGSVVFEPNYSNLVMVL